MIGGWQVMVTAGAVAPSCPVGRGRVPQRSSSGQSGEGLAP